MTPSAIIELAASEGLTIEATPTGTLRIVGDRGAVARLAPLLKEHKVGILELLRATPAGDLAAELDRLQVAAGWAWRTADNGTDQERAHLSRLFDLGLQAEESRDIPTIRAVASALSHIAWSIGARVRGPSGIEEDRIEREAIQWAE